MKYQQLTQAQRYQIDAQIKVGSSIASIARQLGCHRFTVYRELSRNRSVQAGYSPEQAYQQAVYRRRRARKYRIPDERIHFIKALLKDDWSPQQISVFLAQQHEPVSHQWIYAYVAQDKKQGGTLFRHLRQGHFRHLRQGHKRYRKDRDRPRGAIPHAVSIEQRPEVVNQRQRFEDWEVDTVLGQQGTGALVTLLERQSRFYLIKKVADKSVLAVNQVIIQMLRPYQEAVQTITADNGREFCGHQDIARQLDTQVYFAHPYCAWQRGANENANGLLRQYIPKGTDLRKVTEEQVQYAQNRLNFRVRQCLNYRSPAEVFYEQMTAA